jgi:hypothetical protein
MHGRNVRPRVLPLTELDARELLAKPLLAACSEHGPTRVGAALGCNEKTVRDARDEKSSLSFYLAANLLAIDETALDTVLAHFGRVSMPIGDGTDQHDRTRESHVLKAALALSVALADDDTITPDEVRAHRSTIEAARDALDELLRRRAVAA